MKYIKKYKTDKFGNKISLINYIKNRVYYNKEQLMDFLGFRRKQHEQMLLFEMQMMIDRRLMLMKDNFVKQDCSKRPQRPPKPINGKTFKLTIEEWYAKHQNSLKFSTAYNELEVDDLLSFINKKRQLWWLKKKEIKATNPRKWKKAMLDFIVFTNDHQWIAYNGMPWKAFCDLIEDDEIDYDTFYYANQNYVYVEKKK